MTGSDNTSIHLLIVLALVALALMVAMLNALAPVKPALSPYAVQHYSKEGGLIENYPIKGQR